MGRTGGGQLVLGGWGKLGPSRVPRPGAVEVVMSMQPGRAIHRPALDSTLVDLQAEIRAESVRLVDGRTGELLGAAGPSRRDDIAGLVHLAGVALPLTGPDGGLHDLVVAAARATHVLTPGPFRFNCLFVGTVRSDISSSVLLSM